MGVRRSDNSSSVHQLPGEIWLFVNNIKIRSKILNNSAHEYCLITNFNYTLNILAYEIFARLGLRV